MGKCNNPNCKCENCQCGDNCQCTAENKCCDECHCGDADKKETSCCCSHNK